MAEWTIYCLKKYRIQKKKEGEIGIFSRQNELN